MYYILFGGKRTKGNIEIADKLNENNWATIDYDSINFLKAVSLLNLNRQSQYNLVLLDPYFELRYKRGKYIYEILKLNKGRRATAIIKDTYLESTVALYRQEFKFHEISRDSNIAKEVLRIVSLN